MPRRATLLSILALSAVIGGCTPAQPPAPTPPKPKPAAAAPAPPTKTGTMVCRSSIDGRPAKCGTPNAVMVGIKFN